MATGENNTTWGDVTNLNLGTALEEAIVGSADVTFASADVTLTLTDTNASQTARNMRLRCTGTTGGSTRNLVVPSIEKPYIVRNDCADSVVVKTTAGTGITVPAGKTMWVYSDATNVVDAVTHLSSLTLGTDLAVSDGGTGASTFTANGVIYGNTTSALLATAAGTTGQVLVGNTGAAPSWATLTGIGVTSFSGGTTGLTPNTATTGAITLAGTLGVANGGTGTATAFTAGSVVFAGASGVYSQDNANLFWDNTNDRLGIGTATPGARLAVNTGNINLTDLYALNWGVQSTYIYGSSSAGTIKFATNTTDRMTIDASGNVGIGAAPVANTRLYVRTAAITDTAYYADNGVNSGFIVKFASSTTSIGNDFASPLVFLTNNADRMRIDGSGNVGIGTSSPSTKLDVVGTINASDGTNGNIRAYVDGTSAYLQSLNQAANAYRPLLVMGSTVSFANNGVTNVTIDTSGNVGIGTSTTTAYFTNYTSVRNSGVSGAALGLEVGGQPRLLSAADNSSSYISSYDDNPIIFSVTAGNFAGSTGTERMRINSAGELSLQNGNVYGPNGSTGALSLYGGAAFNSGAGITLCGASNASANATIFTRGAYVESMRIDSSGNVGIGTSSPAYKLDVSGTFRTTGIAYLGDATTTLIASIGNSASSGVKIIQFQRASGTGDNVNIQGISTGVGAADLGIQAQGGSVGIGTSSPVSGGFLTVGSGAGSSTAVQYLNAGSGGSALLGRISGNNSWFVGDTNAALGSGTGLMNFVYGANPWIVYLNNAERMRIDSVGNVGIGISSPGYRLHVNRGSAGVIANFTDGVAQTLLIGTSASGVTLTNDNSGFIAFGNTAERMRIDSSGNLLVGTTAAPVSGVSGVQLAPLFVRIGASSTSNTGLLSFNNPNGEVGLVTVSGTATAYNTSSDYRLKEIDGPVANSGAYIDALKPVQGSWKADGSRFIGLLAHEVQEVSETPIATGEKDGEKMQAMDYSAPELIANLIAELQSLRARVAQLEGN
jgi:hypothetical protein